MAVNPPHSNVTAPPTDEPGMTRFAQRLDLVGSICGVLGAALCLLAVVVRYGFGPGNPAGTLLAPRTILLGGIAGMVFGCFLKLSAK